MSTLSYHFLELAIGAGKPWLSGCAEAGNAHCGRKPVGSTLGSHPLVGRLHGFAERLRAG